MKTNKSLTEAEIAELPTLPDGWKWIRIGDLTSGVEYGTSSKSEKLGQVPVLRMGNIQNGRFDWSDLAYTNDKAEIEKYLLKKDDVLFNRTNSPELVGKTAIYKGERPAIFAGYLIRINQLPELVVADYLNYFLNCPIAKVHGNSVKTDGVNQSNINGEKLRNYPFPLPPLPEQRAIVSKIEQLFSELDNGIANLKLAQEQLKVYRQAVLKKAFEGELTKKWREQQTDLPDSEELLERIRKEREEAAKTSEKKVKPLNPLSEDELGELARLPVGWKWVKIGDVSNCLDSQRVPVNKSDRTKRTGNIPYYGANGQVGWIDDYLFDEPLVLVVEDETFTGREKPFSYLITGKSWVNNHAHILQPTSGLDVDFLNYQLSYYPFTPLTTGTTGRKKLTQFALINAPFKICSLPEQQIIVQEIETRLSVCDKIEQDIETNLEKAEALRQSILKKAFEGKLLNERELAEVRGAEDWEPAEVLLEKIRAERAGTEKSGKAK